MAKEQGYTSVEAYFSWYKSNSVLNFFFFFFNADNFENGKPNFGGRGQIKITMGENFPRFPKRLIFFF